MKLRLQNDFHEVRWAGDDRLCKTGCTSSSVDGSILVQQAATITCLLQTTQHVAVHAEIDRVDRGDRRKWKAKSSKIAANLEQIIVQTN